MLAGRVVTRRMSTFRRVEDMVNIGAYARGSNPEIDEAIAAMPAINAFLRQEVADPQSLEQSMEQLRALAAAGAPQPGAPAPHGHAPQVTPR